jgi:hypothetical protein
MLTVLQVLTPIGGFIASALLVALLVWPPTILSERLKHLPRGVKLSLRLGFALVGVGLSVLVVIVSIPHL